MTQYEIIEFKVTGPFLGWLSDPDATGARNGFLRSTQGHTIPFPTREASLLDAVRKDGPALHRDALSSEACPIPLGSYHPRIWRGEVLPHRPLASPLFPSPHSGPSISAADFMRERAQAPVDRRALTSTATPLAILLSDLAALFLAIEPHPGNASTYSHRLRHLLCTACMEVESAWSSVLEVNGYNGPTNLTTRDYIHLKDAMKLDGWRISLVGYPDYPAIAPFLGWTAPNTTASLGWYDAYNKTKHQREQNLPLATLEHAIAAVAAALVMAAAQFGPEHWKAGIFKPGPYAQTVMEFVTEPEWNLQERYWEPESGPWQAVNRPF